MQIDTTGEGEPKFLREEGSFAIAAAAARSSQSDGLVPSAWDGGGGSKVEGRPDGHGVRTEVGTTGGKADERRTQVNRNRKAKRSRRSRRKPKSYHMKQTIGCCP